MKICNRADGVNGHYAIGRQLYERVVEEGNFGAFNREDERLSDCVRRLKNFCDRKQRERTERPRKNSDA